MQSNPERQYHPSSIHPALTSFVDECCATLARLIAYVGALTLFGILALHIWDQFQLEEDVAPALRAPGLGHQPARFPIKIIALRYAPAYGSKFGAVTLLRVQGGRDGAKSCLGRFKRFGDPALQMSGSRQEATLAVHRTAIGCGTCNTAIAMPADWVTGTENPRLRGSL